MRPTVLYFQQKFDYYNNLCFERKLVRPLIKINNRSRSMGLTVEKKKRVDGKMIRLSVHLEFSVRQDLPEEEYIDTLLHEMIHYYIITNNLTDDAPHGTLFRSIMNKISEEHGIRITISYNPTLEQKIETKTIWNFLFVVYFTDGLIGLAKVTKSKLFPFWDAFSALPKMKEVKLYASNRAIVDSIPYSVTPKLRLFKEESLQMFLTGAVEYVREGDVIQTKQK